MNDLNYSSEIKENLEKELLLKYTENLRIINTNIKKIIMLKFIKKELLKIKDKSNKELWENWFLIINNLDINDIKNKEQIELIFLYSVLKTKDFRKFAINFKQKEI